MNKYYYFSLPNAYYRLIFIGFILFEKIMDSTELSEKYDHKDNDLVEKKVDISRPIFTDEKFKNIYKTSDFKGFEPVSEFKKELHKNFGNGKESVKKLILNRIPCLKWLKEYNIKEFLLADILAGLVVGFTHVSLRKYLNFSLIIHFFTKI